MTTHPLDIATSLSPLDDGRFRCCTSQAYANIAGPFGGVTAATLMRAVIEHPERTVDPVAFTVNFCAALKDGDFDIFVKLQRSGKYTQHWSLELEQNGIICATATMICGARGSVFSHQSGEPPQAPPPEECEVKETGGFLKWLERYEYRQVEGTIRFSSEPHPELNSPRNIHWVRDHPERPLDYVSLAAIADTFILRLLYVRGTMAPMGTVSMTTYFHATGEELAVQGSAPLLGVASAERFHGNFHDQPMTLWGKDGLLLASGSQLVWYKE
ncbi:MAG: thioesterase family protein [Hyphomicrobiales bacterium]|nr:thioesterase family protein [Hyphomicrobiales bacterium]